MLVEESTEWVEKGQVGLCFDRGANLTCWHFPCRVGKGWVGNSETPSWGCCLDRCGHHFLFPSVADKQKLSLRAAGCLQKDSLRGPLPWTILYCRTGICFARWIPPGARQTQVGWGGQSQFPLLVSGEAGRKQILQADIIKWRQVFWRKIWDA